MNLKILLSFLKTYRHDLEIICSDGDKIMLHKIFLGSLSELLAELLLQTEAQSDLVTTVLVPSDGERVRAALGSVEDNPDAFVDILFGTEANTKDDYVVKDPYNQNSTEDGVIIKNELINHNEDLEHKEPIELSVVKKSKRCIKKEKGTCILCGKMSRNLTVHIPKCETKKKKQSVPKSELRRIARKEKPLQTVACNECGKIVQATSLKSHIEGVHGEKMKCSLCNFETKTKQYLKRHMRHHEGKFLETCHICGCQSKKLYLHMTRQHRKSSQEKVQCPTCGKSIKSYTLTKHMKTIHTERKHLCNDCDYKTYSTYNLKLHKSKMHGGMLVSQQCQHCDKKTTNMDHHVKIFHPNIILSLENKN